MKSVKSWKFSLSLGCLVLGLLIALQFRQQKQEGFPLADYRPSDLIRMVKDSDRQRAGLQEEVSELRSRLAEYEMVKSGKGKISVVLAKELRRTQLAAGLLPVLGPGVEVVMDDSKRRPRPGEDPYFYLVHDVDLNQLVNELWAIGAEAVAVNGQRVVANSAIRCVGPSILVNTRRLAPPYRVDAVGDPDSLYGGLKMRGGFLDAMSSSLAHGVLIAVAKKESLELPAFQGPTVFHYAKPVTSP